jgi:putative nucleotidyltransferase with HDIG domain
MNFDRISAIILAAGYSSRMGKFKPLLPIDGKTVIERTIDVFANNGIRNIMVVTGHRSLEIDRVLQSSGVKLVENCEYDSGMFSSVKAGIKNLDIDKTDAFFITPADICLIRPLTVKLLAAACQKKAGKIFHPCFDSKRGHPPLISISLASFILRSKTNDNLKTILEGFDPAAVDVQVPDRHILVDMNRPKDYEVALVRWQNNDIPTSEECNVLLKHIFRVNRDVVLHSRKVEQIARRICRNLQKTGTPLNPELVSAAALLHDIAKGCKSHALTGARMLSEMGFFRVAQIVFQHTDLNFNPHGKINEAEIVYMADNLTLENSCTTLERRFEKALNRFGHDPEARAAVARRKQVTLALKQKLERALGYSIESLIDPETRASVPAGVTPFISHPDILG